MKRWNRSTAWILFIVSMIPFVYLAGCSDDPVEPGSTCVSDIETHQIISQPLCPEPGDTTQLTVQATGEGCGTWPTYYWTVEGGELVDNEGISVKWVAPEEFGAYEVSCRATLSGTSPDTAATLILVRDVQYMTTNKRINLYPTLDGNTVRLVTEAVNSDPTSADFLGWLVYRRTSTGSMQLMTETGDISGAGALEIFYSGWGEHVIGSFFTGFHTIYRQQKANVWRFPLLFPGAGTEISQDVSGSILLRRNQHRYPYINDSGTRAVWKFHWVGNEGDGTEDMFNIAYWEEAWGEGEWITLTQSLDSTLTVFGPDTVWVRRYYHNAKPMFTPSEDNILYFVDTSGVYEPCLIPMVGGSPDTLQRRALMINETVGIFEMADISLRENTVMEWRPDADILTFITGGVIRFFDYTTETVFSAEDLEGVRECVWSPDGTQLAAATDDGVFLLSASGVVSPNPLFVKERSTDDIRGLNWNNSDTEPQLVFRLVRKGMSEVDSWTALVLVDVNSGLWGYASPSFPWLSSNEPSTVDYRWVRSVFNAGGDWIYAPIPVKDDIAYPTKKVILISSHE